MQGWHSVLRMVHDNITTIFFFLVIAVFVVAWLVIEAIRSHQSRDEIFKLRKRVTELEHDRVIGPRVAVDPIVLANRWVRAGFAATTNDGGCLILVDRVSAQQHNAVLTLRIDGLPAARGEVLGVGEALEARGKSGTYIVELIGTDPAQAQIGVSLRSHHAKAAL
jgi:hypothetical protein